MTVSTTLSKITIPGNGSTTVFSFSFPGVAPADIQVTFTDASSNQTVLASNVYTLSLNPPVGTNPTGIGGTVTYNPGGTPIPVGTSLTIARVLPFTQLTSLANQGTLFQPVMESALDLVTMEIQQVNESLGRGLTVPLTDPIPTPLPPAALRANRALAFDADGNPTVTAPISGPVTVSTAMIPVVTAATLPAARTAMGLGPVATEAIGLGLRDNGAGSLQVSTPTVTDSTNQSIISSFHTSVHFATTGITYTFPAINTLFNGFTFTVYALTAPVTFAIAGGDRFQGATSGASLTIPPGTQAVLICDGQNPGTIAIANVKDVSLESARNTQISASVASGTMTISLKDRNGNDPSSASPVVLGFRDPNPANGNPIIRAITNALSIVVSSGATLGTTSAVPSRIWVAVFDNAGVPVLGVYNALDPAAVKANILAWDESTPATGTAISASADSPQVWYTNGSITTKSFRILGFIESTQTTAGTWATAPSKIQLFGPGVPKPGALVQVVQSLSLASLAITPISAANLIRFFATGQVTVTAPALGTVTYKRGTTTLGTQTVGYAGAAAAFNGVSTFMAYDTPATTSSTTYSVTGATSVQSIFTEEIFA